MLSLLGSYSPFPGRSDRREVLRAGLFAASGSGVLGAAGAARTQAADRVRAASFGAAKRVLMVYLQGAASQFETWDPRPNAPSEIRGQWDPIPTRVAGTQICEKLPKLANLTDRLAIVRSMTHEFNNHSNLYTLSGYPAVDFSSETNPFDSRHHPFYMSVLDYLSERSAIRSQGHSLQDVPANMGLPFRFSTYSPLFRRSGPYATFLGHGYDPVWTEFEGEATKSAPRVSFFNRLKDVPVKDPYLGITPESRLRVSQDARLRPDVTLDRLNRRRSLLQQFDEQSRQLDQSAATRSLDRFHEMAFKLMTSETLREALDIGREPAHVREMYGLNLFGQSALTARRLLQAGCSFVSVFWDEFKVVNTAWDTHFNHYSRLERELLPGFDAGLSSLLKELDETGLLDETLVLCLTEHGRTPRINKLDRGGGRDHWSKVYSIALAGAGIANGSVVGESDAHGAFVRERPVSPEDILATVYHVMGVSPDTTVPDRLGRPVRLTESGVVVPELLS